MLMRRHGQPRTSCARAASLHSKVAKLSGPSLSVTACTWHESIKTSKKSQADSMTQKIQWSRPKEDVSMKTNVFWLWASGFEPF